MALPIFVNCHAGGAVLVDQQSGLEPVQRIGRGDAVRAVVGDQVGKDMAGSRRRLEAAGSPAAVEIEAVDIRLRDDRRGVRAGVDDAAPVAQHAKPRGFRKQLDGGSDHMLRHRERAALRIGVVFVGVAQHLLSPLSDWLLHMHGVRHDDRVRTGLIGSASACSGRLASGGRMSIAAITLEWPARRGPPCAS